VKFSAPQLRDMAEPFVSAVRENLAGRTDALEDLAVELFARGLSTRDIEAVFTDSDGRRFMSRAAVSAPIAGLQPKVRCWFLCASTRASRFWSHSISALARPPSRSNRRARLVGSSYRPVVAERAN
jgi:hypothetical protein